MEIKLPAAYSGWVELGFDIQLDDHKYYRIFVPPGQERECSDEILTAVAVSTSTVKQGSPMLIGWGETAFCGQLGPRQVKWRFALLRS